MPLATFMYLEFTRMQAASLLQAMEVFVVVFAKRLSSTTNELTLLVMSVRTRTKRIQQRRLWSHRTTCMPSCIAVT